MSKAPSPAFDPAQWNFELLRTFKYPGGVLVYEYKNHPCVDGTPHYLRLNLYLSQDREFITIWFGLLDQIAAETRLAMVEMPPDFDLYHQYNEPLFRGYIESDEAAGHILKSLRLDRRTAPQILSGGADNRLRCDVIG